MSEAFRSLENQYAIELVKEKPNADLIERLLLGMRNLRAAAEPTGLSTPWKHHQVAADDKEFADVNDSDILDATGWGQKLDFVASSPHDDIIFLQGPPGEHFDMIKSGLQIGGPVLLAGFPTAIDQELLEQLEGQPMITFGRISCYTMDFELAAAAYQEDSAAAPRIVETNVNDLWAEEPQQDDEPASDMTAVSSDLSALSLAQHACANIPHKALFGFFVPTNRLWSILRELDLVPEDPLHRSVALCPRALNVTKQSKNKVPPSRPPTSALNP
ncbi:hypothetical protein WJX82_006940 [Trebouxia sp. C0006]